MPEPPRIFRADINHQRWPEERSDGPVEIWHYRRQTSTGYRWKNGRFLTGPIDNDPVQFFEHRDFRQGDLDA